MQWYMYVVCVCNPSDFHVHVVAYFSLKITVLVVSMTTTRLHTCGIG